MEHAHIIIRFQIDFLLILRFSVCGWIYEIGLWVISHLFDVIRFDWLPTRFCFCFCHFDWSTFLLSSSIVFHFFSSLFLFWTFFYPFYFVVFFIIVSFSLAHLLLFSNQYITSESVFIYLIVSQPIHWYVTACIDILINAYHWTIKLRF